MALWVHFITTVSSMALLESKLSNSNGRKLALMRISKAASLKYDQNYKISWLPGKNKYNMHLHLHKYLNDFYNMHFISQVELLEILILLWLVCLGLILISKWLKLQEKTCFAVWLKKLNIFTTTIFASVSWEPNWGESSEWSQLVKQEKAKTVFKWKGWLCTHKNLAQNTWEHCNTHTRHKGFYMATRDKGGRLFTEVPVKIYGVRGGK